MKTKSLTINNNYFKVLNPSTKKANEVKERFNSATYEYLYECYNSTSSAKVRAYDLWERFYYQLTDRRGFYISSYCINFFTLVFKASYENREYIFFITPSYNYCVECESEVKDNE